MHRTHRQLEICAETPQACRAAFEGGAHRIEICSALNEGGLTPSYGLICAAIKAGLPVHVLLRPRSGNFVYSDVEFELICADLEHAASLGASGFVVGVLTPDNAIDEVRLRRLVQLAGSREVTFHRAFDLLDNLPEALEQVIEAGCHRLLTSGGKPNVGAGLQTIADLSHQARGRLRIAAGGGLTPTIATELLRIADVDLHSSVRRRTASTPSPKLDPLWRITGDEDISEDDVRALASLLKARDV